MVKAAREATSPGALRALNQPERVPVDISAEGWPVSVARHAVASTKDIWRVEDEWWRDTPVSRTYFEVVLEDGQRITIFHDAVSRLWQKQRYA
jgi:hypothetical protein